MSRIKDQFMEDELKGYVSGKRLNVCEKHFGDKDIINFIKNNGSPKLPCSFCEHNDFDEIEEETNSVSWDDLLDRIMF